ncbi:hypothetical protein NVP1115B_37 [Vibrio phage 1.115.B._10N.222.49.B11]|nr:hypothetical protein NVP1115A_37 [Vibrio phage 1.115.A._10N.222.49.B11]AUR88583.1 hypothetical protein NVP1115B_37 [Vibrio phage 1.115.B._10N.222.49.B11]
MKNKDMPAMPIELSGFGQFKPEAHIGLTKREMIAMHALQGLASYGGYCSMEYAAEDAVKYADALLKELEK